MLPPLEGSPWLTNYSQVPGSPKMKEYILNERKLSHEQRRKIVIRTYIILFNLSTYPKLRSPSHPTIPLGI